MKPIICISRQFASGGHEIGERLAKKLDVPFYDKELVAECVKDSGLDKSLVENNDETVSNDLPYPTVVGAYLPLADIAVPYEAPLGDRVFQAEAQVIRKLASKGPCVIIGRSAGEILRDRPESRRIFLYAGMDFRMRRAVEEYGCSEKELPQLLKAKDKQRAEHFHRFSDRHWGSLDSFDLAIDSSVSGIDGAVDTVAAYLEALPAKG